MRVNDILTREELEENYDPTGVQFFAAGNGRRALLDHITAQRDPIFCDESFYTPEDEFYRVTKEVGTYFCAGRFNWDKWLDEFQLVQYVDSQDNVLWIMKAKLD